MTEKDTRLLYMRAVKQYTTTSSDISAEEKADAENLGSLKSRQRS